MRVMLDTNIFISYLLLPQGDTPPNVIVEAALAGLVTLLIAGDGLTELARRVATKPYLARRIEAGDVEVLVEALLTSAEVIPVLEEALPAVSRDRKDDYLLAYAAVGQADFLVTGDDDLLSLGTVEGVAIIRPADFVEVLRRQGLLEVAAG